MTSRNRRHRTNRLPIGTKVWIVAEHPYYIIGRAGPLLEYRVYEATVKSYIQGGYLEVCLVYTEIEGYLKLAYRRFSGLGNGIYSTPLEAALAAQIMTDAYDKAWAFLHIEPMRRSWENIIQTEDTKQ